MLVLRFAFCVLCFSTGLSIMLSQESQARQSSCEIGQAEAYLDISNIRARIPNQGGLFFRQNPSVFEAPKNSGKNGIFAAGLWISGEVNGDLRMAATTYNGFEYWPGILDEEGNPPEDCAPFDRIYDVSVHDFLVYDSLGIVTDDLRDWPWMYGAPVIDGDGITDNYNLEGGDRPDLLGDQSLFWMMQDRSSEHTYTDTDPIGIEIRAMAGARYSEDPALANTTFYKYTFRYRGDQPLEDAYIGLFVDPDLGYHSDDYVGADTTLGMGYVYNADNDDEGDYGYGEAPPAIGIDVLQGPLVDQDGLDNDKDGQIDEANERLSMEVFVFDSDIEDGRGGPVSRNYMRGLLYSGFNNGIGIPVLEGCVPFEGCIPGASMDTTTIMAPGDPVTRQFWSQTNNWEDQPAIPGDRKMLISSGPFTMQPGDEQEVVFGIVYARGTDHLDSINELRTADIAVQQAWDAGNVRPSILQGTPLAAAPTPLSPADGALEQPKNSQLTWSAIEGADTYIVELSAMPDFAMPQIRRAKTTSRSVRFPPYTILSNNQLGWDTLSEAQTYFWRVRAANAAGFGPQSPTYSFTIGDQPLMAGELLRLENGRFGFFEVQTASGDDPCEQDQSDSGCLAYGVNLVHNDFNSSGAFQIYTHSLYQGTNIAGFAPHDFEIRFTPSGSYAALPDYDNPAFDYPNNIIYKAFKIPFEVWDIGSTGPSENNDPSDDVQLLAEFEYLDNGACTFKYVLQNGNPITPHWRASIPSTSYQDWADAVSERVDAAVPGQCIAVSDLETPSLKQTSLFSNIRFIPNPDAPDYRIEGPPEGTIIRIVTSSEGLTPPFPASPVDGSGFHQENITLRWQAVDNAFNHIQLSKSPDLSNPIVNDTLFNLHEIEVPALDFATTYYWRARSYIYGGPFTAWSPTWQFTVGTATASESASTGIPEVFEIQQNYPNPFKDATSFRIGLPTLSKVRLDAFNLLGQRVAIIADNSFGPGWHTIAWRPQHLGSGVYIITASQGTERRTMKTVIVH